MTNSKVRHSNDDLRVIILNCADFSEAVMAIYPTTTEETVQCQLRNILSNKKQRYEKSLPGYVPPKRVRKRKVDLCTKYVENEAAAVHDAGETPALPTLPVTIATSPAASDSESFASVSSVDSSNE